MSRLPAIAALLLLAGVAGFLLGGRERGPAPRADPGPRSGPFLEARVAELERRLESLEGRALGRDPWTGHGGAAGTPTGASPAAEDEAPPLDAADRKEDWEAQRDTWVERFREARTPPARVAVMRDAGIQLKRHASRGTARDFCEEILRTVDPASEEGIYATFELGHLARGEGDNARSDEYYRRVEGLVPAGSRHAAEARFQLAWNRKFAGDAAEAERLFRSVADALEVEAGTQAAAHYAVATIRTEAGDTAGARAAAERLLEDAKPHFAHGGVIYYVDLAKKLLASLG